MEQPDQEGVQVVTPDPISSGSARWNLLAAYESQIQQGKSATYAKNYLNSLIANVVSEPSSGSKALTTFIEGTGNVLLDYEADAMAARAAGEPIQIVNPAQNTLIQNPAALTTSGFRAPPPSRSLPTCSLKPASRSGCTRAFVRRCPP